VALCKRCLAVDVADRPNDGGTVAFEVAMLRQATEERAKRAELDRARTEVQVIEQRKRQRLVQIASAVILGIMLPVIVAFFLIARYLGEWFARGILLSVLVLGAVASVFALRIIEWIYSRSKKWL
jgi:hypothetical protein